MKHKEKRQQKKENGACKSCEAMSNCRAHMKLESHKEEKSENGLRTAGNHKTYGEPTEEEKQRVMADGRVYSSKWREQAQGRPDEYVPEETEFNGEML